MTAPQTDAVLPFVTVRKPKGSGFCYWDVKPTGDYGADCNTGHALVEEYLAYIGANPTYGNGTLLTCIVREMIDQAKDGHPWSGVHVGFLAEVNRYAMTTARLVTPPQPVRPEGPKLRLVRGNGGGQP
jgi:hypothetical protein